MLPLERAEIAPSARVDRAGRHRWSRRRNNLDLDRPETLHRGDLILKLLNSVEQATCFQHHYARRPPVLGSSDYSWFAHHAHLSHKGHHGISGEPLIYATPLNRATKDPSSSHTRTTQVESFLEREISSAIAVSFPEETALK